MMIRIGVLGLKGKMGKEIQKASSRSQFKKRVKLVTDDPDLWIEFSSPAGALELCQRIVAGGKRVPLLVGSTGWSPAESKKLSSFAKKFPILRASNFSFGIQLCRITLLLWKSYPEIKTWKLKIRDLHHSEKKDAPSGTALTLRKAIGREVPITSIREGKFVGTHEMIFESDSEILKLIHEAKRRSVFAEGALEAAIQLAGASKYPKRLLSLDDLYLRRKA